MSALGNVVQKKLSVTKWCVMELREQMEVFIDPNIGAVEIRENRSGGKKKTQKVRNTPVIHGGVP